MAGGAGSLRKTKKNKTQRFNPLSQSVMPIRSHSQPHRYTWVARFISLVLALSLLVLLGNSSNTWLGFAHVSQKSQFPQIYTGEVVHEYPHDRRAFTQGLLYGGNNTLYESTGLYGKSSVRRVALQTGKVEAQEKMDSSFFGEGLTLFGERLYQVTWLQKTGFIYDRNNLSKLAKFTHEMNDGWGLATDGKTLFGSDGSSTLYHIDPKTMKVMQKQTVRHKGLEVPNLNELEFVNGEVWANVYQTDCIARIEPGSGTVSGWILLPNLRRALIRAGERGIDVLNGIAWDDNEQRIFVTGKLWPKLYEIKVQPIKEQSQHLLVSEYIDNGDLHQWLHVNDVGESSPLTWRIRMIISGIAKGLAYIHEVDDVVRKAVHGRVKSSKILLDRQWNPKISGYVVEKLIDPLQTTWLSE